MTIITSSLARILIFLRQKECRLFAVTSQSSGVGTISTHSMVYWSIAIWWKEEQGVGCLSAVSLGLEGGAGVGCSLAFSVGLEVGCDWRLEMHRPHFSLEPPLFRLGRQISLFRHLMHRFRPRYLSPTQGSRLRWVL